VTKVTRLSQIFHPQQKPGSITKLHKAHPLWIIVAETANMVNPFYILATYMSMCYLCRMYNVVVYFGSEPSIDEGYITEKDYTQMVLECMEQEKHNRKLCDFCRIRGVVSEFSHMEEFWFEDDSYWIRANNFFSSEEKEKEKAKAFAIEQTGQTEESLNRGFTF